MMTALLGCTGLRGSRDFGFREPRQAQLAVGREVACEPVENRLHVPLGLAEVRGDSEDHPVTRCDLLGEIGQIVVDLAVPVSRHILQPVQKRMSYSARRTRSTVAPAASAEQAASSTERLSGPRPWLASMAIILTPNPSRQAGSIVRRLMLRTSALGQQLRSLLAALRARSLPCSHRASRSSCARGRLRRRTTSVLPPSCERSSRDVGSQGV